MVMVTQGPPLTREHLQLHSKVPAPTSVFSPIRIPHDMQCPPVRGRPGSLSASHDPDRRRDSV